jgi:hypothetical protein
LKFRVGVQIPTPSGDLGVQVGHAIYDRHWIIPVRRLTGTSV